LRPAIGLCTAIERAHWGVWDDEAALLPRAYATAVQRAGGIAVMLPPDPDVDGVIELLDGLILAGGADYGEYPERDAFELALASAAL
jgi:putative glutamine amidotransferase